MTLPDPRLECERLLNEAAHLASKSAYPEAETCYRQVVAIDPMRSAGYHGLAQLAIRCGNGAEAVRFAEMALTITPNNADYRFTHGLAAGIVGDVDTSMAAYRRALRLEPSHIQAMNNLIFTSDLHPNTTPAAALALRRQFDATFCLPYTQSAAAAFGDHKRLPDPNRRLRIGYVSGDFRAHSAAAAFGPIIMAHDRDQFELYLYSTMNPPESEEQRKIFQEDANWREVDGVGPGEQAQAIADDRIDVLIDLSGFTAGSALQAFAMRPAPIQISAWGYISGTGMTAMDCLFADAVTVPEGHEQWYAEKIVRMPAIFPYAHNIAPEIRTPTPFERNGYKTYGYLGRGTKVTYATLDAWSRVLLADLTSKLILKSDSYRQDAVKRMVVNGLIGRGVDTSRITVLYSTDRDQHLMAHNEVDVILDPVPQTGGISTCDALLMGVPVVTLLGQRIPERVSASILTSLGLETLIAASVEEYVSIAVATVPTSTDRLAVRAALGQSPLADHAGYTRTVEETYRRLWRCWCYKQNKVSEVAA